MSEPSRSKRGLPGALSSALYVAAVVAPLGIAALSPVDSAGFWTELATVTGLLGCAMLIAQFVTSGRLEWLSGRVGIDHTMAFHKWAARILLVLVVVHPLLFVPFSISRFDISWTWLITMLGSAEYLTGTIALGLIVVVVALALLRDRLPIPYEAWRASHGLLALAAVWLAATHAAGVGTYSRAGILGVLWPVLAAVATAILLGLHAVKTFLMYRSGWRVSSVKKVADGLWELMLAPTSGRGLDYRAGQFAWVTFGRGRLLLFDHPFSIASSPAAGSTLAFLIKEAGDFTDGIGRIAPGTAAGLDAPHGSFTLDDLDCDAVVLVAGGAGIAPVLGILRDLDARRYRRPVRLIYAGRDSDDLIDPASIVGMLPGLDLGAEFLIEANEADWGYGMGRVGEAQMRTALRELDPRRTAVMLCGPGAMMTAAADAAERLGVPGRLIRYERFDYSGGHRAAKDRRVTALFWAMAAFVMATGTLFALR